VKHPARAAEITGLRDAGGSLDQLKDEFALMPRLRCPGFSVEKKNEDPGGAPVILPFALIGLHLFGIVDRRPGQLLDDQIQYFFFFGKDGKIHDALQGVIGLLFCIIWHKFNLSKSPFFQLPIDVSLIPATHRKGVQKTAVSPVSLEGQREMSVPSESVEIVGGDDRVVRGRNDMGGNGEIAEHVSTQCIGLKVFLMVPKRGISGDDGIGYFHAGIVLQDVIKLISGREESLFSSQRVLPFLHKIMTI